MPLALQSVWASPRGPSGQVPPSLQPASPKLLHFHFPWGLPLSRSSPPDTLGSTQHRLVPRSRDGATWPSGLWTFSRRAQSFRFFGSLAVSGMELETRQVRDEC